MWTWKRSSEKLNRRAATNTEMPNFDNDDEWIDKDLVENATALLATVRDRLTGMEIDMCEKLASMSFEKEWDSFYLSRDQLNWFNSLCIQFYAKISNWKDGVPA